MLYEELGGDYQEYLEVRLYSATITAKGARVQKKRNQLSPIGGGNDRMTSAPGLKHRGTRILLTARKLCGVIPLAFVTQTI